MDHCRALDHICNADFPVHPLRLSAGLDPKCIQIFHWWSDLSDGAIPRPRCHVLHHSRSAIMNTKFLLHVFVALCLTGSVFAAPRKLAYEHAGNIFLADLDGTHARKVAAGALPEISPDGTRVAFNTEGNAKNRPGPERHIAVADVATGKVNVLQNVPSDNCFGPVWSPDGKQLLFMIMAGKQWQLGFVNADGSGFHFLNNSELNQDGIGGQAWSSDGK